MSPSRHLVVILLKEIKKAFPSFDEKAVFSKCGREGSIVPAHSKRNLADKHNRINCRLPSNARCQNLDGILTAMPPMCLPQDIIPDFGFSPNELALTDPV